MTPETFAYYQYRDYVIYKELIRIESNPQFKQALESLIQNEIDDYHFWRALSSKKDFHVPKAYVLLYVFLRRIFGLTFTAKFLEGREKDMIKKYSAYLATITDAGLRKNIEELIRHEVFHERQLISQVREDKVAFISSIILGINDGLIELTGALVGFSFAFQNTILVLMAGVVTGVAAALSMASSAYMQARHEEGKDPQKAAFYTGISYFFIVALLLGPYILTSNVSYALVIMAVIVVAVIGFLSFYTSILFERSFLRQFREMFIFSIGTAVIAFLLGVIFRTFSGVTI